MTPSKIEEIELSVIIVAWNGIEMLRECLLSIKNQTIVGNTDIRIEVIVVSNFGIEIDKIAKDFPFAKYVLLSGETTVPMLRTHGILEATGKIIALSEDICLFNSDWCQEIIKAHASEYSIIGGAIENIDKRSSLNWAVYFFDYGKYMLPNQKQVFDTLSGMNVSYKRKIMNQFKKNYEDGFFETSINEELKQAGHKLYFRPSAIVLHNKNYNFYNISLQFYHQARSFASRRAEHFSVSERLFFTMGSLLIPMLLLFRFISRIIIKRRLFRELILSLAYLTILINVWAFGEFWGYLIGGGKSGQKWK